MKTKECTKCKEVKSTREFSRSIKMRDGLQHNCKVCRCAINKAYRQTENGKIAHRRANKKHGNTENGKRNHRRAFNKYKRLNLEKISASAVINHAVSAGKIPPVKSQSCWNCRKPAKHYHHPHYDRPNLVVPLCRSCHLEAHKT